MTTPTRRAFLSSSAALAVPAVAPAVRAEDRLPIALIGCGGMGTGHLRLLAQRKDVAIKYVCDVDRQRLTAAAKIASDAGHPAQSVGDLRKVLDDKEVTAVWQATPDHWHAPGTILAAEAGKHVYVEKPCSHNVREGRLMIEAAQKNKVLVQIGTQARSTPTVREAMARLHSGAIGDILVAKAWNSQLRRNLGKVQPSNPPEHLDFDQWLGPAPQAPYFANRIPAMWRYFFDYGVGDMGNDGVHNIDVALWGIGVDRLPDRTTALGGKYFFDDDQQWPDTQYVAAEFATGRGAKGPIQFIYEQRIWSPYVQEGYENGNAFYGTQGMLIMGHTVGWKLYGPRNQLKEEMTGRVDLPGHHTNFLEAIRKGIALNAPVLAGHLSAGVCHLANMATRLSRVITLDPSRERVLHDPEADGMLRRQYRPGHWAVPRGV